MANKPEHGGYTPPHLKCRPTLKAPPVYWPGNWTEGLEYRTAEFRK